MSFEQRLKEPDVCLQRETADDFSKRCAFGQRGEAADWGRKEINLLQRCARGQVSRLLTSVSKHVRVANAVHAASGSRLLILRLQLQLRETSAAQAATGQRTRLDDGCAGNVQKLQGAAADVQRPQILRVGARDVDFHL